MRLTGEAAKVGRGGKGQNYFIDLVGSVYASSSSEDLYNLLGFFLIRQLFTPTPMEPVSVRSSRKSLDKRLVQPHPIKRSKSYSYLESLKRKRAKENDLEKK